MNYYQHHLGDYSKDTAHLSLLEHGAYRRMLDVYYGTEKPLPKDKGKLYRLVQVRSASEKKAVNTILEEFFTEAADGWRNARADAEIAKFAAKSESARNSAAQRWHSDGNANASKTHTDGNAPNNQYPITNNQEPESRGQQRSRGSRLPPDWQPSDSLKTWSSKARPDLDLQAVVEKFSDYWRGVPGSRGVKLDWDATFRNFVRTEKPGSRGPVPNLERLQAELEAEEKLRAAH